MSITDLLNEIEQFNFEIENVAGISKSFNPTMIQIILLNGWGNESSDVIPSIETSNNYNINNILLQLQNVEVSMQIRKNPYIWQQSQARLLDNLLYAERSDT